MAGELKILGWIGTSPEYREVKTPIVSYTPQEIRAGLDIYFRKQLNRELICFSQNAENLLQQLTTYNAELTVPVISDANGTLTNKAFGGGWNLTYAETNEYKKAFSKIYLRYEKQVTAAFEFNLPPGLTITNASGVCTIAYDGTTLETIDSETGTTTSGLQTKITGGMSEKKLPMFFGISEQLDPASVALTTRSSNQWEITHYEIDIVFALTIDGVVFETMYLNTAMYPESLETVYAMQGTVIRINPAGSETTRTEPHTIMRVPANINKTLRWDTSEAGHIKLVFWDHAVRDWDVSGL
ncbi:MAG: hypothetical protein B6244_14325 [Candidatus Cloacimonetes bacterium 4572_55]|nr:MAG: hypothetical protein B6244_14325 [Candidatus Cloacimonetes bacterium 4572_55]